MPDSWIVSPDNKERLGPYTLEELRELAAVGWLAPENMLLRDGSQQWTAAGSIEGLFTPVSSGTLLDRLLEQPLAEQPERPAPSLLDSFLGEPDPWRALALWIGATTRRGRRPNRARVLSQLARDIARLDDLLSRQVNAILHHPFVQRLEATWRGLRFLVEQAGDAEGVKIKALSITWRELTRDFEKALEFDQSQLFRLIYNEEFGTPGGEPYGLLLGDYEVHLRPGPDHPTDDLATLEGISSVAAAAFTPFVAAAHPSLLSLDNFTELERPRNLSRFFEQPEFIKWRALRQKDDSRFLGLTLPRVLMRLPYRDGGRADCFRFHEQVGRPDRGEYLWGSAVWAFGSVVIRTFATSGWLAGIRGVERGVLRGGLVVGLPAHAFRTERPTVAPHTPVEVIITDAQEKELGELGFIPLCYCQDTPFAAFYGNQSVQKPAVYDELPATINARLSSMLQYTLCVSRFAHYIKVITRDKIGAFAGPGDCEDYLRKWLLNYIIANDNAGQDLKVRYPLREARVDVKERPGKPGSYLCVMRLRPHYQLDQMVTGVRLVTELAGARQG